VATSAGESFVGIVVSRSAELELASVNRRDEIQANSGKKPCEVS
jgi:hypothetical protein